MDELMDIDTSLSNAVVRAISELSFFEGLLAAFSEGAAPVFSKEYAERAARARTLLEAAWNSPFPEGEEEADDDD